MRESSIEAGQDSRFTWSNWVRTVGTHQMEKKTSIARYKTAIVG